MSDSKNYQKISIESLVPFANHPFKPYDELRLADMAASIKENGVITPIIVCSHSADDNKYEILSGHNRVTAARMVGLTEVHAVVHNDLSDDAAMFIVTETNLIQRSFADMKHSERAIVITIHYEAMKKKSGYRSDLLDEINNLTLSHSGTRSATKDKIAEQYGLSKNTVMRYLHVNKLIQVLKEKLDEGNLGLLAAVELSYLRESEQILVAEFITKKKILIGKAKMLRNKSKEQKLNEYDIKEILIPEKPVCERKTFKIKSTIMSEYFSDDVGDNEIENVIDEALKQYFAGR